MKRIILSMMVIFCMMGAMNAFAAQERANIGEGEYEIAQKLMDKFEIMEYLEENTGDIISRADFAVYLARLIKINEYEVQNFSYYTDMGKNHYGLKSVNYLTEIGALDGCGNMEFRPEEPIAPIAAAKIIFNVLGYGEYAELHGGYPQGYLDMANTTELLDGFLGCSDMTRQEVTVLLMRAGFLNRAIPESISTNGFILKTSENEDLFSIYWDVYKKEGIITAADYTSLDEDIEGKEGHVWIDDQYYAHTEKKASDLLGCYVNAVVTENDKVAELICAVPHAKKNDKKVIAAEDINKYSNFVLSYYNENGKLKNETIETDAIIVLNGLVAEYSVENEIMNMENGDVTLIDSDGNGEADTVLVNSYKTYIVGFVDREKEIIYDHYTKSVILELKDYKHKRFYSVNGANLDINSISVGSVLNVKENGGVFVEIYIQNVAESGTITAVFNDETTGKDGIEFDDGKRYLFDTSLIKNSTWFKDGRFIGKPGENISYMVNMFGEIANITGVGSGIKQVAYVIKAWYSPDDEIVQMKLLKEDGSVETMQAADRVQVDGRAYKTAKDIYDAICMGDVKVIFYSRNTSGQVSFIDTSYYDTATETNTSLIEATQKELYPTENNDPSYPGCRQWYMRNKCFGRSRIMVSADTVIFQVPNEPEGKGDEYYTVENYTSFSDGKQIRCNSYKFGEENFFDDVVVLYSSGASALSYNAPMLTISKVTKSANDDGEIFYNIQGITKGKEVSYNIAEKCMEKDFANLANDKVFTDASQLEPGDLILYGADSQGQITSINLLVDISDGADAVPTFASGSDHGTAHVGFDDSVNRAYCSKVTPEGIELSYTKGGVVEWKGNFDNGVPTITVVDMSDEKQPVKKGTIADIVSYEIVGENLKPMYIYSTRQYLADVVVYK